jgi:hypothetical protein
MLAEQVQEVYLRILKIEHPDLASPLLLVANMEEVVRSDGTYVPFGFDIKLPDDDEENINGVDLIVPSVDLTFVSQLRNIQDEFTVTFSVIRASDPDTVEIGPFSFVSQSMTFDLTKITVSLVFDRNISQDAYPKDSFTPSNEPSSQ